MLVWFNKSDIEQTENPTTIAAAIAAIDAIILTLLGAMAKAATTANMEEYRLDDGQTKISVRYKDLQALSASHMALIRTKQYYINAKNGRMSRLMDSKNMPNWRINNV
jgi:hypothetical protein